MTNTPLRQRNRELRILNAIASALNREVNLSEALQTTLAQVLDLLDLQTGWIWLLRETSGESYLAAFQQLPPALRDEPARMEGSCYCLDTYHQDDLEGAANINVITCSRLKSLVDGTDGLRYHASIPLYAQEKKLGILNVASPNWRKLSADDLRILHTVGDLLSMAIERARLFAQSTHLGAVEERNRLAREIHDTLAQGLTGIALKLETADALLDANHTQVGAIQAIIQDALKLTQANLEEARRSVLDLRAAPLEGRNLGTALRQLVENWAQAQTVTAHIDITGASVPLPLRIETGLYRIAQETLANIAQHAQASQIWLTLSITPQHIDFALADDGRGFDPTQICQGHFGLIGLNERAKLLGGTLDVESTLGEGSRIVVRVPVE